MPASPKVLTSFPSLSPQAASPKRKRPSGVGVRSTSGLHESSGVDDSYDRRPSESTSTASSRRVSSEASNVETPTQQRKPASSISKTLRGAANLHKSILAGLTFRGATQEEPEESVFKDPDWEAADPLEKASDEQIKRVIEKNGGAISILRQYSTDLAESNTRVAQERNSKLEVIERNRKLRDDNELLRLQLEETHRKYKNVQNLFKRYVRPEFPGQIQIVDSPNGHYILGES